MDMDIAPNRKEKKSEIRFTAMSLNKSTTRIYL